MRCVLKPQAERRPEKDAFLVYASQPCLELDKKTHLPSFGSRVHPTHWDITLHAIPKRFACFHTSYQFELFASRSSRSISPYSSYPNSCRYSCLAISNSSGVTQNLW